MDERSDPVRDSDVSLVSDWSRLALVPAHVTRGCLRRLRPLITAFAWAALPTLGSDRSAEPEGSLIHRGVRAERAWTDAGRRLFDTEYPGLLNCASVAAAGYGLYAAVRRRPVRATLGTLVAVGAKLLFLAELVRWHERPDSDRLRVTRSVRVPARRSEVFEFMDEPENQAAITPAITDIRDVEALENGGKRLAYTYRLLGIPVDGTLETPVYEPDERVVFELSGTLSGTITWTFEADGDETRVTYSAAYDVPVPVRPLETALRPLLARYNERQLRQTLENLRAAFPDGAA